MELPGLRNKEAPTLNSFKNRLDKHCENFTYCERIDYNQCSILPLPWLLRCSFPSKETSDIFYAEITWLSFFFVVARLVNVKRSDKGSLAYINLKI